MTKVLLNVFRKPINRKKCTIYQRYTHLNLYDDTKTFPCSKNWFKIHEKIAHRVEAFRFTRYNFSDYIKRQSIFDPFLPSLFLPNLSTLSTTKTKLLYSYYTFEIFWQLKLRSCHLLTFTFLRPALDAQMVYTLRISMS